MREPSWMPNFMREQHTGQSPDQQNRETTRPPGPPPSTGGGGRFLVFGGIVAAVLAGAAIAVSFGHKSDPPAAQSPDPGISLTPEEVLSVYLIRAFVERDSAAAKAIQCKSPELAALENRLADLKKRESTYGVKIDTSWKNLRASTVSASAASVDADLTLTVADGSESMSSGWTFLLSKEGFWKVCRAQQRL